MDRRAFLSGAGALGLLTLAGCAADQAPVTGPTAVTGPTTVPAPTRPPRVVPGAVAAPTPLPRSPLKTIVKQPLPRAGVSITGLPVDGPFLSWTVDDGSNAEVIRRYAQMAKDTGTRLTFFPNGKFSGWEQNADLIRPMVESGQIEIGNHTYSHADLTKLSDQQIKDELTKNDEYLTKIFGRSPKPFYRPPYGYRDDRTDRVAASIGYTNPVMWYGSLSDSGLITQEQVVDFARKWFLPKHVVIGHANFLPVCDAFPTLLGILKDRGLNTVTLRDVFVVP